MEDDVQVNFDDAAGVDEAKQELVEIIDFLVDRPDKTGRMEHNIQHNLLLLFTNCNAMPSAFR